MSDRNKADENPDDEYLLDALRDLDPTPIEELIDKSSMDDGSKKQFHESLRAHDSDVAREQSVKIAVIGGVLALASFVMPSHNDAHVSEPPALSTQIERAWGLDEMGDCKNTSHGLTDSPSLPKSSLDDGDWKCVAYTDSQRTELTVHIKGNKVGLYKADGKALKPVGKD